MAKLTPAALQAWQQHESRMVFSSCVENTPNSIWVLYAKLINEEQIVSAKNAFFKTLQNIKQCSKDSLLYIAPEGESYQIYGSLKHFTDGEIYNDMKQWLDAKFPGNGALLLNIEEIFYAVEEVG